MTDPAISLATAAALVFPDGTVTETSLRTEYRAGRLRCFKVAGKLLTTETAVREMLTQCHAAPKAPACISAKLAQATRQSGLSETDSAKLAQAAAKGIAAGLKKRSQRTSPPSTTRPSNVTTLARS
jgi:hypothetical protein